MPSSVVSDTSGDGIADVDPMFPACAIGVALHNSLEKMLTDQERESFFVYLPDSVLMRFSLFLLPPPSMKALIVITPALVMSADAGVPVDPFISRSAMGFGARGV